MNLSWIPVLHYLRNVEWLYSESRMVHLWLEILFRVQRSADTYPIKGTTIDIMPGQFVASTRKLATAIGADKDTVGRYLKILESQRWIERRDIGNATLYTILAREQIPEFSFYAKDRDAGSPRPIVIFHFVNRAGIVTADQLHILLHKKLVIFIHCSHLDP